MKEFEAIRAALQDILNDASTMSPEAQIIIKRSDAWRILYSESENPKDDKPIN